MIVLYTVDKVLKSMLNDFCMNRKYMFSVFQWHEQLFICGGTGVHVLKYKNQTFRMKLA